MLARMLGNVLVGLSLDVKNTPSASFIVLSFGPAASPFAAISCNIVGAQFYVH